MSSLGYRSPQDYQESINLAQSTKNVSLLLALLIALAISSVILLVGVSLPDGNSTFGALQNFGHFLLFALLGWAVLLIVDALLKDRVRAVLVSGVALFALGLGVELIQSGLDGRDASLFDLILDVAGAIFGFLCYFLLFKRGTGTRGSYFVMGITMLVLLGGALVPVVPLVGFDLMRPSLPVVRSFSHPWADRKVEPVGGAEFVRVENQTTGDCCVLQVTFNPAVYSGVIFQEHFAGGAQGWSDFSELNIKVFNSLPDSRQIELRINDRLHNLRYEDRYNGSFLILPGQNELTIPVGLIEEMGSIDPAARRMDIDDITHIQIFANDVETSFTLDLLSIELS